jgi:hypothetical protein
MEMTQRMKIDRLMQLGGFDDAFEFTLGRWENISLVEELMVGGEVAYRLTPLGTITDRVPE